MQAFHNGIIEVNPLVSHRYQQLADLQQALSEDFRQPEYIKGVFALGAER